MLIEKVEIEVACGICAQRERRGTGLLLYGVQTWESDMYRKHFLEVFLWVVRCGGGGLSL